MIRYILLSVEKRENGDSRSIGELFFHCYDAIINTEFSNILALIMSLVQETLEELLFLSKVEVVEIIDKLMEKLQKYFSDNSSQKVA